jgi:hypothetical protein
VEGFFKPGTIRQMDYERIESRPFFRFKDFCDGKRIQGISRQPVNGFGWQRDDFTGLQKADDCDDSL